MTVMDLDGRKNLLPLDGLIVAAPDVVEEILAVVNGSG